MVFSVGSLCRLLSHYLRPHNENLCGCVCSSPFGIYPVMDDGFFVMRAWCLIFNQGHTRVSQYVHRTSVAFLVFLEQFLFYVLSNCSIIIGGYFLRTSCVFSVPWSWHVCVSFRKMTRSFGNAKLLGRRCGGSPRNIALCGGLGHCRSMTIVFSLPCIILLISLYGLLKSSCELRGTNVKVCALTWAQVIDSDILVGKKTRNIISLPEKAAVMLYAKSG